MTIQGVQPSLGMEALSMSLLSANVRRLVAGPGHGDSDEQRLAEESVLNELCADRDLYGEFSTIIIDTLVYELRTLGRTALDHAQL